MLRPEIRCHGGRDLNLLTISVTRHMEQLLFPNGTCGRLLAVLSPPVPFPNSTLPWIIKVAFRPPQAFSEERIVFVYNLDREKSQMKFLNQEKGSGTKSPIIYYESKRSPSLTLDAKRFRRVY